MRNSEIRKKAREQLGNGIFEKNWLYALLLLLAYDCILGFCSTVLAGIGTIVLGGTLEFIVCYMFLKQARNQQLMDFNDYKVGIKDGNLFVDLLLHNLIRSILIALWSLLFCIPGIIKAIAYSMSFYIKNDHPEYDWKTCIKESEKMMKGHKWQYFVLQLSFIGWILVGCLTFGIGLFWVMPYMKASEAQFYLSIKQ